MKLIDVQSNQLISARISQIQTINSINDEIKQNFSFDWSLEEAFDLYRIYLNSNNLTIGLMSITNFSDEFRIHVNLIESSIPNRGKLKKIQNIPHCLIAYVCKLSFAYGYDGFVSLFPKTELVEYYKNEYGFQQIGKYLAIYGETSYKLINEYLDE